MRELRKKEKMILELLTISDGMQTGRREQSRNHSNRQQRDHQAGHREHREHRQATS